MSRSCIEDVQCLGLGPRSRLLCVRCDWMHEFQCHQLLAQGNRATFRKHLRVPNLWMYGLLGDLEFRFVCHRIEWLRLSVLGMSRQ